MLLLLTDWEVLTVKLLVLLSLPVKVLALGSLVSSWVEILAIIRLLTPATVRWMIHPIIRCLTSATVMWLTPATVMWLTSATVMWLTPATVMWLTATHVIVRGLICGFIDVSSRLYLNILSRWPHGRVLHVKLSKQTILEYDMNVELLSLISLRHLSFCKHDVVWQTFPTL